MTARPRILCLDDEPFVLEGLQRSLRSSYEVVTTTEPEEALRLLADREGEDAIAVIVSDMRMPAMSGVAVLERAQQISPETTRVLLTGDADMQVAVAAINLGNVFRFILKPCPPDPLRAAITAAAAQHRLLVAERELLQDTLKGCIDALMDTLAMAQPALFSRAGRLRRLVHELCGYVDVPDAWQVEMAAQLGEIGAIMLPPAAMAAFESGLPGSDADAEIIATLPGLADNVLSRIPRLEAVREIIRCQLPTDRDPGTKLDPYASEGALLLQAVREYDALVHRGTPEDLAIVTLAARDTHLESHVSALAKMIGMRAPKEVARQIAADELRVGHELACDLRTANGILLVSRGQLIDERLLVRVRNFAATGGLQNQILILDVPD